jgi:hypothetical protein
MAAFRIHRLKPAQRLQFRWSPHTSGAAQVKPKDYEESGSVESAGSYAAWTSLRSTPAALEVGDIIESEDGKLWICKYVGFEEAQWAEPDAPKENKDSRDAVG